MVMDLEKPKEEKEEKKTPKNTKCPRCESLNDVFEKPEEGPTVFRRVGLSVYIINETVCWNCGLFYRDGTPIEGHKA